MTRVAVNHHAGWMTPEPIRALAPRTGNGPLAPASFDQTLDQARRLAATPPGSPASSPSSGPPQPPPSRPTSPSQSTNDARPQAPESRDPPSRRESDPDPDSSPAPAEAPRPEDAHRDGEENPDDSVGGAAAAASALATISGEGDGSPAPLLTDQECVDALGIAPDADKVGPVADDKRRVVAGKQTHANGNLRDEPEKLVENQAEVSESQVPSTAKDGENADLPAELSENAEASPSDARDRETPSRVAEGGQISIPSSKAVVPLNGQATTEAQLPPVETVVSAARPVGSDPLAKAADDRSGKSNVPRLEGRRAAKAASPATPGPAQARTEEENARLQAAVRSEVTTAPTTAQAAQGEREARGGDARSDRPTDAKTSDAALPRGSSVREAESVSERAEPKDPTDETQRARFVQRVARAFESAADRGGHIRLRLHPPELGALRLELTVRDGQMHARLETETEAAKNLLLDNLPELKERLASHQIRVERFDVEWRGQAHGGPPQGFGDPGRWQGPPAGRAGRGPEAVATNSAANPTENVARRPSAPTSFDVLI